MNRPGPLQRLGLVALSLSLAVCAGCHSATVQARVINHTGNAVHLFEVDYPSASFGSSNLANDASFPYRFKILGDGTAKLTWTDASERDHAAQGPALHEGEEGTLTITLTANGVSWDTQLHRASR